MVPSLRIALSWVDCPGAAWFCHRPVRIHAFASPVVHGNRSAAGAGLGQQPVDRIGDETGQGRHPDKPIRFHRIREYAIRDRLIWISACLKPRLKTAASRRSSMVAS